MDTQLVFCLASGRSGTGYLNHMLNCYDNCISYQEPDRDLIGTNSVLFKYCNGKPEFAEKNWEIKKERIQKRIKESRKEVKVCAETYYLFLPLWSEFVMRDIPNVKLIDLKRELAKVALSFYKHSYFHKRGGDFLLHPPLENNLTILPEKPTYFDRAVWYVFEIEVRKKVFKEKYSNIPIFEFDMDNRNRELYERLTDFLGLKISYKLSNEIKRDPVINSWEPKKEDINLEKARELIDKYEVIYK